MPVPAETSTGHSPDGPLRPRVWPASLVPSELSVHPLRNSTGFESPFTRFGQVDLLPGSMFLLSASFQGLDGDEAREFRAFMASLRGSSGRFYAPLIATDEPCHPQPSFATTPGPEIVDSGPRIVEVVREVNGLDTKGWNAPPGTLLLERGSYVSFDDARGWRQAFVLVDDCICDQEGYALLTVEPELPPSVPAGALLHVSVPSAIFVLEDDDQGDIPETPDGHVNVSFSAIQALQPDFSHLIP